MNWGEFIRLHSRPAGDHWGVVGGLERGCIATPTKDEPEAGFHPLLTYSAFGKRFVSQEYANNCADVVPVIRKTLPCVWRHLSHPRGLNSGRRAIDPNLPDWAGATATGSVATKWGRSSPVRCFARVQIRRREVLNSWIRCDFGCFPGEPVGERECEPWISRPVHHLWTNARMGDC
jgi:hypothetical protein